MKQTSVIVTLPAELGNVQVLLRFYGDEHVTSQLEADVRHAGGGAWYPVAYLEGAKVERRLE